MKIRSGFVSNSSSSSFIVIGKPLSYNEVVALLDGDIIDSKEGIYVHTFHYLSEGEDFFKLTPEMLYVMRISDCDYQNWDFYNVHSIQKDHSPIIESQVGMSIYPMEVDYCSTNSLEHFMERYIKE